MLSIKSSSIVMISVVENYFVESEFCFCVGFFWCKIRLYVIRLLIFSNGILNFRNLNTEDAHQYSMSTWPEENKKKSKPIDCFLWYFLRNKLIYKETKRTFLCLYAPRPCINTLRSLLNEVHNLSEYMHVLRKIYWKFHNSIIYIENEGRRI